MNTRPYAAAKRTLGIVDKLGEVNWGLVLLITICACAGFAMLYSVANGNFHPWAMPQIVKFVIGFVILVMVATIDVRVWMSLAYPAYGLALLLVVAVDVVGHVGLGAQRWLNLGGMEIQPSELMKISLVLALARFLHGKSVEDISKPIPLLIALTMIAIPALFVALEPNLGTTIIIAADGCAMLFLAGLSWQRSLDLASYTAFEGNLGAYPYGSQLLDYGPSDYNRKLRGTGSFNYLLPGPKTGAARYALGGWQLNGILILQTGGMLNFTTGFDNSFSGIGGDRPDPIGKIPLDSGRSHGEKILKYFNTAAFTANAPGTFGMAGRNIGVGPGFVTADLSVFKAFVMPYSDRHKAEFRAEFFNSLNRVNLGNPNATFSSSLFGRITSAGDPRILQLGLRYSF